MIATSTATITEPTAPLAAPSQLALDNIVETLAALVDEALAITGAEPNRGQATLIVSGVPAPIWHALHGAVSTSTDYTWKEIAHKGLSRISAFCEHGAECPDRPPVEESPS
jgi:hypothetical protein